VTDLAGINAADDYIEEDTQKGKYLTFSLDTEYYGIEIKHVTEIISVQSITEFPEMPEYIRGIINLRGMIIQGIHHNRDTTS